MVNKVLRLWILSIWLAGCQMMTIQQVHHLAGCQMMDLPEYLAGCQMMTLQQVHHLAGCQMKDLPEYHQGLALPQPEEKWQHLM